MSSLRIASGRTASRLKQRTRFSHSGVALFTSQQPRGHCCFTPTGVLQQQVSESSTLQLQYVAKRGDDGHEGSSAISLDASWIRTVEHILARPAGSLSGMQWEQAQQAIRNMDRGEADFVERSLAILDRLHQEVDTLRSTVSDLPIRLPLTQDNLRVVIKACRQEDNKSISPNSLLQKIREYAVAGMFLPDSMTYTMFLHNLHNTAEPSEAPVLADAVLKDMMRLSEANLYSNLHPDLFAVTAAIELWSKSGRHEAPVIVEQLFQSLKHWYSQTGMNKFRPNEHLYATVLSTWNRSTRHGEAGLRAMDLLDEMKQNGLKPNSVVYGSVLQAMTRQRGFEDAAMHVLDEMRRAYNSGHEHLKPNATCFTTVISAYARQGDSATAVSLLNDLESLYIQTDDPEFRPNSRSFGAVLNAYSKKGDSYGAERILRRILQLGDKIRPEVEATVVTWTTALHAWADSGDANALERAKILFDDMKKYCQKPEVTFEPNVATHNAFLRCHANSRDSRTAGRAAESHLRRMESQQDINVAPNAESYQNVLEVWKRAGLAEEAESLLDRLCALHRSGKTKVIPDVYHFTSVLRAWARSGQSSAPERSERLLNRMKELHVSESLPTAPDVVAYSTVLDCWSRSRAEDAAERAERIVLSMLGDYRSSNGNTSVKPNVYSFTTVIAAWSRSGLPCAPDRAENLLRTMQQAGDADMEPNAITYDLIIRFYAKHRSRPDKVQELFDELKERYRSSGHARKLRPNVTTYNALLTAWARAGEPDRATAMLMDMLAEYEAGHVNQSPRTRDFNTVLNAWTRSSKPHALDRVEQGLTKMIDITSSERFHCPPDVFSYSYAIACWCQKTLADGRRPQAQEATTTTTTAGSAIARLLGDLEKNVEATAWEDKEQAADACARILNDLDRSFVLEKSQLIKRFMDLMKRKGLDPQEVSNRSRLLRKNS